MCDYSIRTAVSSGGVTEPVFTPDFRTIISTCVCPRRRPSRQLVTRPSSLPCLPEGSERSRLATPALPFLHGSSSPLPHPYPNPPSDPCDTGVGSDHPRSPCPFHSDFIRSESFPFLLRRTEKKKGRKGLCVSEHERDPTKVITSLRYPLPGSRDYCPPAHSLSLSWLLTYLDGEDGEACQNFKSTLVHMFSRTLDPL